MVARAMIWTNRLRLRPPVLILGGCLGVAAVPATAEMDLRGYGAGLYVSRDDTGITNADGDLDMQVDRIGIRLSERVNPRLKLGLEGGIVAVDVTGQAVTDGMQLSGNFLGVSLGGTAFAGTRVGIDYRLGLSYQSAEDGAAGQKVEQDWLESELSVSLRWRSAGRVSIFAGSRLRALDLDQRMSGAVDSTASFEEQGRAQSFAGASLEVDPGGFIDLAVYRGSGGDGFALTFSREY